MPAVYEAAVGVGAVAAVGVNAPAHVAVHPGAEFVECGEGERVVGFGFGDGCVLSPGFAQDQTPGKGVHFLNASLVKGLGCAVFAEARFEVGPGSVPGAAEADDIAPVAGVEGEARVDLQAFGPALGGLEFRPRDATGAHLHTSRLPTAQNAQGSPFHIGLHQFFKNLCRRRRFDGFRAAEGVARAWQAVGERVVGAYPAEHFEKETAARKVGTRLVDAGPFVDTADALRAELAAEPVDVVDQHHFFHAQPGGLYRSRAGGFIAADNQQIGVQHLGVQESREEQQGKKVFFHGAWGGKGCA